MTVDMCEMAAADLGLLRGCADRRECRAENVTSLAYRLTGLLACIWSWAPCGKGQPGQVRAVREDACSDEPRPAQLPPYDVMCQRATCVLAQTHVDQLAVHFPNLFFVSARQRQSHVVSEPGGWVVGGGEGVVSPAVLLAVLAAVRTVSVGLQLL